MESELVRHADVLFGESMTRALHERVTRETAAEVPADQEPSERPLDRPAPGRPLDRPAPAGEAEDVPRFHTMDLTARQERRLWHHIEAIDGFWELLKEIEPGAVARLAAVAQERRWEVIFLTKRPESAGATAQVQSQRWLQAHGFALPSVFVVQGSRGRVADALQLDFVIDDRPENCLDVVLESTARALLVWRDDEKRLPVNARRLGVGVVKDVAEGLAILEQVDEKTHERPGLVDRVKKRLGFNEPADP